MNYTLPKHLAQAAMRQADDEIRAQHERGIFGEGDPNHPKYSDGYDYTRPLFGYKTQDFLRKQYR